MARPRMTLGYPRGPDGQPLCRLCRRPKSEWTEKRRRAWCGAECVHRYNLVNDPQYLRRIVMARDHGVCAGCGLDCLALETRVGSMEPEPRMAAIAVLEENGFSPYAERYRNGHTITRSLWEADHVEAMDEGGRTDLDNVQTLCQPCHKEKTAEQAGRRARQVRLIGKKWRSTQELLRLAGKA